VTDVFQDTREHCYPTYRQKVYICRQIGGSNPLRATNKKNAELAKAGSAFSFVFTAAGESRCGWRERQAGSRRGYDVQSGKVGSVAGSITSQQCHAANDRVSAHVKVGHGRTLGAATFPVSEEGLSGEEPGLVR